MSGTQAALRKYVLYCSVFLKLNLPVLVAVQAWRKYDSASVIPGLGAR